MVVSGRSLAPLVRLTALTANRSVRYATPGYSHPYPTRQGYVRDIIERHSEKTEGADILRTFMQGVETIALRKVGS